MGSHAKNISKIHTSEMKFLKADWGQSLATILLYNGNSQHMSSILSIIDRIKQ